MRMLFLPALLLVLCHARVSAQQSPIPVWRCELPGGVFVVDPATISSVSTHEYTVDGAVRVTEVTIATTGSLIGRFYYQEPTALKSPVGVGQSVLDRVQEKVQEGATRAEQAGVDPVWKKVVKSYPTSTHAHTVEYRLDSRDQVDKIFNSALNSWRKHLDTTLKIP